MLRFPQAPLKDATHVSHLVAFVPHVSGYAGGRSVVKGPCLWRVMAVSRTQTGQTGGRQTGWQSGSRQSGRLADVKKQSRIES